MHRGRGLDGWVAAADEISWGVSAPLALQLFPSTYKNGIYFKRKPYNPSN
jgi:hypothetical protein